MERDIGPLKCSKLNCYVEFNKMVQALNRHKHRSTRSMPGISTQHGTSAEYNFYTTLYIMLQQIKSGNNTEAQKRELQDLYQWFIINKPYTKPKPKPLTQKPSLKMTSIPSLASPIDRPQTAPAAFHNPLPSSNKASSNTSRRPSTSFTTQYMTNSLGSKMNLIGNSLDHLEITGISRSTPDVSDATAQRRPITPTRPSVLSVGSFPSPTFLDRPNRSETTGKASKCSSNEAMDFSDSSRPISPSKSSKVVSVQSFPSSSFLSDHTPAGHTGLHPQLVPQVYVSDVFSLAPQVAAKMVLEREESEESDFSLLRKLLKSTAAPRTSKKEVQQPSSKSHPAKLSIAFSSSSPHEDNYNNNNNRHRQQNSTSLHKDHYSNHQQQQQNSPLLKSGEQGNCGSLTTTSETQTDEIAQSEEPNSANNFQFNKLSMRRQNLPDISEETDSSIHASTMHGSDLIGNPVQEEQSPSKIASVVMDPVQSDVELSANLVEDTGKLHYNSCNSFLSYPSDHQDPIPVSVSVKSKKHTPLSSSQPKIKPHSMPCSVVSISFEAPRHTATTSRSRQCPRTPNRTPNTAGGFRKRRYHLQSAKKLQVVHTK